MANLKRNALWALGLFVPLLAAVLPAESVPSSRSGESIWQALSVWRQPQGLPQDLVFSILQTSDGYLWAGTSAGLARFDGVRFTTFDDGHGNQPGGNEVWALVEGDDQSLWIGVYGGGLTRYKNGQFTTYTTKDGLIHNFVTSLCKDRDGAIWVGTDGGLSRFQSGHFTSYTKNDGLFENAVTALHADREGNVWVGTKRGGLNRISNGSVYGYPAEGPRPGSLIWGIWRDRSGSLWVATVNGLFRFENGKSQRYTARDGLSSTVIRTFYEDELGNLWIGTPSGLTRYKDGRFSSPVDGDPALFTNIVAVTADRDGNLWLGSADHGLVCLRQRQFVTYTQKDGLIQDHLSVVLHDTAGKVWVGAEKGLSLLRKGVFTNFSPNQGMPNNFVVSLAEDKKQYLWVGTEVGLYRSRSPLDCRAVCAPRFDKVAGTYARVIFADRDGNVWIGSDLNGLIRYDGKSYTAYTTQDGLASNAIRAVTQDAQGTLWVGTRAGLSRYQNGKFVTYGAKEGLVASTIQALYLDHEGILWIAARQGLSRLKDNRFTTYTVADGLRCDLLYSIIEDGTNNLWMTCNKGIFRVSRNQLNDFADGKIRSINSFSYGLEDGLLSTVVTGGTNPESSKSADGKLWFPTLKGLSVVDPASLFATSGPPPVHLEQVTIDNHDFDLSGSAEVPPGRGDLTFHYTGINFQAPTKTRFKYKLEGYDSDWVDADSRRIAQYTNTRPGSYVFRVIAANDSGVWSPAEASYRVYLTPHFYQTYWFYSTSLLVVTLSVFGAHWLHTKRLRKRKIELTQIVRERTEELRQNQERLEEYQAHLEVQVAERTAELSEKTEQLMRNHCLLQGIIDNSSAVIYVKDLDGRYLLTNRRFSELFHVDRQSVRGKTDHDLFPAERADAFRKFDQQVLSVGTIMEAEEYVPQDDGVHSYISIKSPLADEAGKPYAICGISTDISERKRLEKQLFQAQKMEAIGHLAGGIAHDFNNLLTIINGGSEILRDMVSDAQTLATIDAIHEAGTKAGSLTRQLLAFSRRQLLQPKVLNLNEVLADLEKLLHRLVREDIEIEINTDPDLGRVRCDPSQMEQVVVNLVVNACDAMSGGGRLHLETANLTLNEAYLGSHTSIPPGFYVCLTVTDTGCGMDVDTQAHIFEPFFTTKEGKGTGLGLATVYGVMQQVGGHISVHSSRGSGSTFRLYFPRVEANASAKIVPVAQRRSGGSERILVVEDQDGVRRIVCNILQRSGYTVEVVRSGQEALRLAQGSEAAFDLVITDIVMPQMSGRELAARLVALHPETEVLFMSGYTDMIRQDEEWAAKVALVQKPFSAEILLQKVRESLDRRSTRIQRNVTTSS